MSRIIIATVLALVCIPASARDLTIPDPVLTPGVTTTMSVADICDTRWGKDHRAVTSAMKREVFANYGLKGNVPTSWCRKDKNGRVFEIDHSCSRENGGADDVKNLWPQCYSGKPNATDKDRLENYLHGLLCKTHQITLPELQAELCLNGADWRKAYKKYFGAPAPKKKRHRR